jgi:tRNA A37 N6-isopentenylltransferase MiaA
MELSRLPFPQMMKLMMIFSFKYSQFFWNDVWMFLADQQHAYVKTCVCVCVCEQQLACLNTCVTHFLDQMLMAALLESVRQSKDRGYQVYNRKHKLSTNCSGFPKQTDQLSIEQLHM